MHANFHAFVFISTVIFYIILRKFKRNGNDEGNEGGKDQKSSNLIYVLCVPIILYTANYFYNKKEMPISDDFPEITLNSELLSEPYPLSTNTFSS